MRITEAQPQGFTTEIAKTKKVRRPMYVWTATWVVVVEDKPTELIQLLSAVDLRQSRVKAEKFQKDRQFDGELVGLVRSKDVVI